MVQKMWEARIVPGVGGGQIKVSVMATDATQAKKLIQAQYNPKSWNGGVVQKR